MRTIVLHEGLPEQFFKAMDKISKWGLPHYTKVDVYKEFSRNDDMIAVFSDEQTARFTMGCIWDKEEKVYEYHS